MLRNMSFNDISLLFRCCFTLLTLRFEKNPSDDYNSIGDVNFFASFTFYST